MGSLLSCFGWKIEYISKNLDVPIVIVTSEISPWSKSGGLAVVTATLAVEFAKRGHRTMAISPMYDNYEGIQLLATRRIWLMGAEHEVKYFHLWKQLEEGKGVDYVFVDHPCYHRPGGMYYNAQEGVEYADNLFRFTLFCLATLDAPMAIAPGGVAYGEKVLFIANDWQSALLPVYLTHRMRPLNRYSDSRCIFLVHNFGYQGIYPCKKLVPNPEGPLPMIITDVDIDDFGLGGTMAHEHMIYQYPVHERSYDGDDGNVWNLTKGAVLTCDRIITVSPGYAVEMRTREGGFRLADLVRQKKFFHSGILNGIDVQTYDPTIDPNLAQNYNVDTLEEGKACCKLQLQQKVGLQQDAHTVLVSFVGRLTSQKGIDLILESIDWLMTDTGNSVTGRVQVLLLGDGDECFAQCIRQKAETYPGKVAGVKFDQQIEHLLYAGSDLLWMPSRYEPCGLPQMCAQRYGTVPVVSLCGGLKDSVIVEPVRRATGFGILPLNINKFKEVTYRALDTYYNRPQEFRKMQRRGLRIDFSWHRSMGEYERHVDWCLDDPPYWR